MLSDSGQVNESPFSHLKKGGDKNSFPSVVWGLHGVIHSRVLMGCLAHGPCSGCGALSVCACAGGGGRGSCDSRGRGWGSSALPCTPLLIPAHTGECWTISDLL